MARNQKSFGLNLFSVKDVLTYVLVLLCGTMFYLHKFIDPFSDNYRSKLKMHKSIKKYRTQSILNIIEDSKGSSNHEEYLKYKTLTDEAWKEFQDAKKEEKILGFKSIHFFIERFGLTVLIFTYALFNLFRSFYFERKNISNKVFHTFVLSVGVFNLFWIFNTFQDFSDFTYFFMTIFSAFILSVGVYLFIKYRKTTIQKLEENNQEAQSTIEQLEKEVLTKQEKEREEERQRISEELHDGALGKLFGTRMGLGFLDLSNTQSKEKYQSFLNELQEVEKEIREVSHKLSTNLDGSDIGFVGIVEQLLKDKSVLNKSNYTLDIDKSINWKSINEVHRVNLYRIIQEALQNIIKHAKAKNVRITITYNNNRINTEIKDDGVGFDTSKRKKGIGVNNIKSRVKRLKGSLLINSESNKGTSLNIEFPFRAKELDSIGN